jgi:membrane-bound lytic murein transglycosylase A
LGEPLTADRSVALDHDFFPPAALGFLQTRKPLFNGENQIIGWAPLQRFVVNQDSGSAIKGPGGSICFWAAGSRPGPRPES